MPKPAKRKVSGGRVTPKAGDKVAKASAKAGAPPATSRYTPPIPRDVKVSPIYVPIVMFTLLGLGLLVILLNYVDLVPGGTSNWYLLGGLGSILAGIIVATQYH